MLPFPDSPFTQILQLCNQLVSQVLFGACLPTVKWILSSEPRGADSIFSDVKGAPGKAFQGVHLFSSGSGAATSTLYSMGHVPIRMRPGLGADFIDFATNKQPGLRLISLILQPTRTPSAQHRLSPTADLAGR